MKRIKKNQQTLVESYLHDNHENIQHSGCSTIAEYLKSDLNEDSDYWWYLESDTDINEDYLTEEDRKMVEEWIDANYDMPIRYFVILPDRIEAYGYDSDDRAEVEMDMQKEIDRETEDDGYAYEVLEASFYEDEKVWTAKLLEHEKSEHALFEILMGQTKEEYKKENDLLDWEVEKEYKEAEYNFNRHATFIASEYQTIEDFQENAEFGETAVIEDVTYFKVRNQVDGMAYTIYFDEHDELRYL